MSADNLLKKKKNTVCFKVPAIRWKGCFTYVVASNVDQALINNKKLQCVNTM